MNLKIGRLSSSIQVNPMSSQGSLAVQMEDVNVQRDGSMKRTWPGIVGIKDRDRDCEPRDVESL